MTWHGHIFARRFMWNRVDREFTYTEEYEEYFERFFSSSPWSNFDSIDLTNSSSSNLLSSIFRKKRKNERDVTFHRRRENKQRTSSRQCTRSNFDSIDLTNSSSLIKSTLLDSFRKKRKNERDVTFHRRRENKQRTSSRQCTFNNETKVGRKKGQSKSRGEIDLFIRDRESLATDIRIAERRWTCPLSGHPRVPISMARATAGYVP